MTKYGLTAFDIFTEKNIEKYKDYDIKPTNEKNTLGIASNIINDEKIWYIYATDNRSVVTTVEDGYKDFNKIVEDFKKMY